MTLNGSGIQLAVGPQPLWLRNHNFGLAHRIMVKRLATSPHDPLGITDSSCKNQLVVVSVQYGLFYTYILIRSTTIGKSRFARDPTAMHTSWRSNSDIASVTSIGYPRMKASGESSTTKHRLLHASGPHPIPPPNDPNGNDKKERAVEKRKAEKPSMEKKTQAESMKEVATLPTVEAGGLIAPTMSVSETSSDKDSCPLVTRQRKRSQVEESSDSEDTTSAQLMAITKNRGTMRTKTAQPSIETRMEPQSRLVSNNQIDDVDLFTSEIPEGTLAPTIDIEDSVDNDPFIMAEPMVRSEENPGCKTQMDHLGPNAAISVDAQGVEAVQEQCQLILE
ncbi:hypothetical protein F511_39442 [Dorcoceras hygrometricum]|uniref:Uncharacterized protein n=1 Tax=Dorcoceras hygrometricum TaxID=472368 RepID=A0A2Z7A6X7_9LAMI|nr:hypothetical protein F511_39442 [Dorcoceras hygrometricum]